MPIKFWLCGWCYCDGFGFYNNDTYCVTSRLLGRSRIYLCRRGKRIFDSRLADLPGFKLKKSECRVWRGNAQAVASSLGINLSTLSSSKCSLAASQDENLRTNSLRVWLWQILLHSSWETCTHNYLSAMPAHKHTQHRQYRKD